MIDKKNRLTWLEEQIKGKKTDTEKLQRKLEKLGNKSSESFEFTQCQSDLDTALNQLASYQEQLKAEVEKANSRNIAPIVDFLNRWKKEVLKWYKEAFDSYAESYLRWCQDWDAWTKWKSTDEAFQMMVEDPEEFDRRHDNLNNRCLGFQIVYGPVLTFVDHEVDSEFTTAPGYHKKPVLDEVELNEAISREADRKYDFIVEKTNAIVGQITDASNLSVSDKQDLNGYIIGTRGKASVKTIGAGGYNADTILKSGRKGQCFHFRTLIKPIS